MMGSYGGAFVLGRLGMGEAFRRHCLYCFSLLPSATRGASSRLGFTRKRLGATGMDGTKHEATNDHDDTFCA